jgi:hypothetical protein
MEIQFIVTQNLRQILCKLLIQTLTQSTSYSCKIKILNSVGKQKKSSNTIDVLAEKLVTLMMTTRSNGCMNGLISKAYIR